MKSIKLFLVGMVIVMLTACGGGSGGDSESNDPTGVTSAGITDGSSGEDNGSNDPEEGTSGGIITDSTSSVSRIAIFPSDQLSIFPGQVQKVGFLPEFLEEDKNTTTHLENNPDWITLDANNTITLAPSASLSETMIGFTVITKADGETVSKSKEVTVTVLKKVVLVSGELGPDGGTIENGWKNIAISVDAGKLNKIYNITYSAGMDTEGAVSFTLEAEPIMSRAEMSTLNILKPSVEIIKNNYLSDATSTRSRDLRATNPYALYSDDTVDDACRPGEKRSGFNSYSKNEMVWTDENEDDYYLSYVWQGTEASFDESPSSTGLHHGVAGGYPRLQNSKTTDSATVRCASALRSHVAKDSNLLQGRVPVLLVHGHISSGKLGGYDHDAGKPGGEYFGKFPKIIDDLELNGQDYVPFVFQWRTNAKFEDVASELARAIKQISEKTGNKVHIVAHSFGGILSRTLIQRLATNYPSDFYSEDYIQALTTVGTPHSGTFGSSTSNVSFDGGVEISFPEGRNGVAGGAIQNCVSITCYQTGTNEGQTFGQVDSGFTAQGLFGGIYRDSYGTKSEKGYVSYKLAQTVQSYPNINTQVLIGLVPADVECKDKTYTSSNEGTCNLSYDLLDNTAVVNPGIGDRLISLQGQRFYPGFLTDSLVNNPTLHFEEHFLPFNTDTGSFWRGMDDAIMDLYETDGIHSWNKDNYGTVNYTVTQDDDDEDLYTLIEHDYISGYNHRTGQFNEGADYLFSGTYLNGGIFSEVGLHECTDSDDCNHGTWNYFKSFIELNPIEPSPLLFFIPAYGVCQAVPPSNYLTRSLSSFAPLLNATIKVFANDEVVGSSTTNEDGAYNVDVEFMPNTDYYVEVHPPLLTGYLLGLRSVKSQVIRTKETLEESSLNFPITTLVENMEAGNAMGHVELSIKDGTTGVVLAGFDYQVLNGWREAENSNTSSTLAAISQPAGEYKIVVSKDGYNDAEKICNIQANATSQCEISMIPIAHLASGDVSAVLTWAENPDDLDSHLVKYDADGNKLYHIYFGHQTDVDANLDVDDVSSYGPETITINNVDENSRYVYAIYHFSGTGSITTTSAAQVTLQTNGVNTTYYAPTSGEGQWWKVFEINNGRIIPCHTDCMFNDESSALRSISHNPQWLKDIGSESKVAKQ